MTIQPKPQARNGFSSPGWNRGGFQARLSVTDEILCTGTVKNIATLIAESSFPPSAFFLAERLPPQIVAHPQERQDLLRFARVRDLKLNDDEKYQGDEKKQRIDPALYTTGRIFAPDFELRWSQEPTTGQTRIVYLGSERELPGLEADSDSQERLKKELEKLNKKDESKKYYLFGEPLDGERFAWLGLESEQKHLEVDEGYYAELRIPRLLRYPVASKRRVQLIICEYIEEATGGVQLFRFQDLREVEAKHESI